MTDARDLVGLLLPGRMAARPGDIVFSGDAEAGAVTSGLFAPSLNRAAALAYVDRACAAPGRQLEISARGRRLPAVVATLPLYTGGTHAGKRRRPENIFINQEQSQAQLSSTPRAPDEAKNATRSAWPISNSYSAISPPVSRRPASISRRASPKWKWPASSNASPAPMPQLNSFCGGGFYDHFIPAAVDTAGGPRGIFTAYALPARDFAGRTPGHL